ncbi:MAG TPA: DUF4389 domain-containing protein [Gaiellaceae bacterium]|nr:DUF4389 domain-containing protein [Gaiellaceae bacterium]
MVTDDLERSRVTVFFRWLLAIPLLIWLVIWSIGVFFVGIVNWFVTLVKGRTPLSLHDFFASYVRFTTHVHAYLFLAADPYPSFAGKPGYPIDVEIDPPEPQSRWKTAFRVFLALPAIILASALIGTPGGGGGSGSYEDQSGSDRTAYAFSFVSAFLTISVLAWFAALVRGRMPHGLRDLFAYGLRYGAQAWGYLFLLTDRYPDADPELPPAAEPEIPRPVRLVVEDDLRRSRLTVFFRFLLFLPHLVWLILWSIAAWLAAVVNWFATLALGRSPAALHRFLAAYVRYVIQVYAYLFLVANPFPGFVGAPFTYPVEARISGPEPQARWKTLIRFILAIPAFIISGTLNGALFIVAFFGWFVALALGRMPHGYRNLGAWALRYTAETDAYFLLLTDVYPYSGPWEFAPPAPARPEPEPELETAFA